MAIVGQGFPCEATTQLMDKAIEADGWPSASWPGS
jgi:hypothetical protein